MTKRVKSERQNDSCEVSSVSEHVIIAPAPMPGANEIIAASKSHYARYASMKRTHTDAVAWAARAARVPAMQRATVHCRWIEPHRRRDPDNITGAVKFVLDGLVTAGVLPNDGWRHVAGIGHSFGVDRDNPRVEITVIETEVDAA